ncbi:MAG: cyclic nucleotide-binding domain-containing protein [Myxococcota bacterium]
MQVNFRSADARTPVSTVGRVQRTLILKTFPGFARLEGAELAVLEAIMTERVYRKGELLHRPGELVESFHFIVEGQVQNYRLGVPTRVFGSRSVVGGIASLTRDPEGAHVEALTDVLTLVVHQEDMADVFEEYTNIALAVMRSMAEALREMQIEQVGNTAPGRHFDDFPTDQPLGLVEKMFVLRQSTNYGGAGIEPLAEIAKESVEVRFEEGMKIWSAGDLADWSLTVVSGRAIAKTPTGHTRCFPAGWVVGGPDAMSQQPRWYDLYAGENLVGLKGRTVAFHDVLEEYPELTMHMLQTLARAVGALLDQQALQQSEGEGTSLPK